jgi:hypothetical protein
MSARDTRGRGVRGQSCRERILEPGHSK